METQTGEFQAGEQLGSLSQSMERMATRLEAAATLFERTVAMLEEREGEVRKMVAAVETGREAELEKKLAAAEVEIAELRAQLEAKPGIAAEAQAKPARRTVPASTAQFLAKQGINTLEQVEAGALDAALQGLSLEQRIAVKAQLLRAGVVG